MTSPHETSEDRPPESRRLTETISRISAQKAEPPGKAIAMVVLAVLVVAAVIYQIVTDTGPGRQIRDNHPEQPLPSEPPPSATPGPEGARTVAIPRPSEALVLPEGISAPTGDRLRLALAGLRLPPPPLTTPDQLDFVAGAFRQLPIVVGDAPPAERDAVRAVVLERLVPLVARPDTGGRALDAALEVMAAAEGGPGPMLPAALDVGLAADATAPAAILFLRHVGSSPEAVAALEAVVADAERPRYVRTLAGDLLQTWGVR